MTSTSHKLESVARYSMSFIFISWVAIALGYFIWSWEVTPAHRLPPIPNLAATAQDALKPISGNLFGFKALTITQAKPLSETRLQLTLKGVLPSAQQEESIAFISSQGGPDEMYRVGDTVSSGVTLDSVFADRVILSRGGTREILYFLKSAEKLLIEKGASQGSDTENRISMESNPIDTIRKPALNVSSTVGKNAFGASLSQDIVGLSPKALLDRYEQAFQRNPEGLLSSAGLTATGSSYKVINGSPLIKAGLRVGDEIVSVNGQAVGNIANDQSLASVVRSQNVARIEIRRNEKRFYVNYAVK